MIKGMKTIAREINKRYSENKQFRESKRKERWSPRINFTNVAVLSKRVIVDMPRAAQRVPLIRTVGSGVASPEALNVLLTVHLHCTAHVLHGLHCIEGLVNAAKQLVVQIFALSFTGG